MMWINFYVASIRRHNKVKIAHHGRPLADRWLEEKCTEGQLSWQGTSRSDLDDAQSTTEGIRWSQSFFNYSHLPISFSESIAKGGGYNKKFLKEREEGHNSEEKANSCSMWCEGRGYWPVRQTRDWRMAHTHIMSAIINELNSAAAFPSH